MIEGLEPNILDSILVDSIQLDPNLLVLIRQGWIELDWLQLHGRSSDGMKRDCLGSAEIESSTLGLEWIGPRWKRGDRSADWINSDETRSHDESIHQQVSIETVSIVPYRSAWIHPMAFTRRPSNLIDYFHSLSDPFQSVTHSQFD